VLWCVGGGAQRGQEAGATPAARELGESAEAIEPGTHFTSFTFTKNYKY
jgi:hypothetical protein